jgi:hypothetical protein
MPRNHAAGIPDRHDEPANPAASTAGSGTDNLAEQLACPNNRGTNRHLQSARTAKAHGIRLDLLVVRCRREASILMRLSQPPCATAVPSSERKGAIHDDRWRFTILGAYKRRWAPYVQAHGPGQGQLPLDRVWPQGLWFLSGSADRNCNIGDDDPVRQRGRINSPAIADGRSVWR